MCFLQVQSGLQELSVHLAGLGPAHPGQPAASNQVSKKVFKSYHLVNLFQTLPEFRQKLHDEETQPKLGQRHRQPRKSILVQVAEQFKESVKRTLQSVPGRS